MTDTAPDEAPPRASSAPILAWYRVDRGAQMRGTLVTGALSMATGSLVVGLSYLTRQPYGLRVAAAVMGFVCVVFAPLYTLFGLRRELAEDLYVALRKGGLDLHLEGPPRTFAWTDIARVAHDDKRGAGGAVVLDLRSGETIEIAHAFAGITRPEFAKTLDAYRRKSDFGLLR